MTADGGYEESDGCRKGNQDVTTLSKLAHLLDSLVSTMNHAKTGTVAQRPASSKVRLARSVLFLIRCNWRLQKMVEFVG